MSDFFQEIGIKEWEKTLMPMTDIHGMMLAKDVLPHFRSFW